MTGLLLSHAYAALQLAEHPKIDGNRVAIVGFSFGGEVAHLAAFASARSALRPDETRFAAHVSFYPAGSYAPVAEANAYTGAPILMLLGENDDNLPITKVEGYLSYAKAAGMPAPIELIVYSGAQHAWTASSVGAPRFCPQYGSTRKCPFILLGRRGPALLIDGLTKPFNADAIGRCLRDGRGYSMAYNRELRAKSIDDAATFLQRELIP